MSTVETLVLVDGSSYLYRAFHALPPLTSSKGEPTGAIHGVAAMLRRLLKDHRPDYCAVVFDAKGKTFRDELYPDYKAHRPPMPDDLRAQIAPLCDIIKAMGFPMLQIEGVEADDVIGTLAAQGAAAGMEVTISTGDKDFAQMVNGQIRLVNTMDNSVLDAVGVEHKFGVPPGLIIDYLTLVGDAVDNVPGVPKVGPKTAVNWLKEYGSLDAIMAQADSIKGKVGDNLRGCLDRLPLSRRLVTIVQDVPLALGVKELKLAAPDNDALREIYTRLEFKTWLGELLRGEAAAVSRVVAGNGTDETEGTDGKYETILTQEHFERWLERLQQAPLFAFDTETTSLNYMVAEIVGVSFAIVPGEAAYVPLAHDYLDAPDQLERERVLAALKPLLEDPKKPKLGQNLKYDRNVLANHGIELLGIAHDTMLESYVLDSTATQHDMDSLALKYLGHRTIHFEDIAGKGAKQLTFNQIALEQAAPYAAEDADVTLQLHRVLWPKLEALSGLKQLYESIEIPLVPVLSRIERQGVLVDAERLTRQSEELRLRLQEIEGEAHRLAGESFNLGSPKQIQAIFFDKLKLPVLEKTPTGQPSTAESVLQELALDYPLPKVILEHRALSKLKSTYTDCLPRQINPKTGRVHTSYHQAVAATGRLSSSDPNLQNIPIRNPEGRRIRQAFIAPPGCRLVAADYSQIELRIMAHLSGDERLLQAFSRGEDIHRATAAEVFGLIPEQVNNDQRRTAKAINFGLIYGMSAFGLGRQLGIERGAAQAYVDRYFARYPGVKAYMDKIRAQAREQGFVETVYQRRLYLPEINARNAQRRQYAERTAINAPMQGTAADIIKRAMLRVDDWLRKNAIDARIIMQVHDELVVEVAESALAEVKRELPLLMAGAADLSVPLVVDVGVGQNWDEAH